MGNCDGGLEASIDDDEGVPTDVIHVGFIVTTLFPWCNCVALGATTELLRGSVLIGPENCENYAND